ncbi:MAG: acetate--CoA ligase family protein [Proteobacteria bacterium]|nr:acetate--CoA ligase family protein [Pseudomonadota bacterium]MBU4382857.1 acetate--CoA ligase family protein [Pseudomonadota bacterium]MBU4606239.1 acetate--CoA ligase family protein [Pseudomonadota bacterium]
MEFFFNPSSVAVVGASPERTGKSLLVNTAATREVAVYPVNPKYQELEGLTCYPSVAAIPHPVEMAILLVPARFTPQILEECAAKGVRGVMIQSAGFAETGEAGRELQAKCVAIARQAGMRLWGPNCMGLVDVPGQKYFTFMSPNITRVLPPHGTLSLVVQSGMLSAGFLADLATRRGIAVNKACSIGNKCDVDECDVLEYMLHDDSTKGVALYLESMPRGRRFMELAEGATKPLVVLKSGRSASGAKAALSHTASLAGNARLTQGLLQAVGVGTARDFHQLVDLGRSLSLLPEIPAGARVAVITFSGGAGILSCDLLEDNGLPLADLAPATLEELAKVFPAWMPPGNPVDLWPAMELHGPGPTMDHAVQAVSKDPNVDLVLLHTFLGGTQDQVNLARYKELLSDQGKGMVFWALGLDQPVREFETQAQAEGVPVFGELARTVDCLAAASHPGHRAALPPRPQASGRPLPTDLPPTQGVWDEYQSKRLLRAWKIPTVAEELVADLDQARSAADRLGWPVVLKGLLPGEVHKSEKGLVCLNLDSPAKLERELDRLRKVMEGQGSLVLQAQRKPDYELIVGYLKDAQFGPCVMLGVGGVTAELEPDVAFEMAPLDPPRALAMLDRLRMAKRFAGFRGETPLNREALAQLICRLGDLGASHGAISQVDLNPVAVCEGEPLALDANIIWEA